jgi:intein-encoded DNA endonuclease-like protein
LQVQLQAKDETFQLLEKSLRSRITEEETKVLTLSQEKIELRENVDSLVRSDSSYMRQFFRSHGSMVLRRKNNWFWSSWTWTVAKQNSRMHNISSSYYNKMYQPRLPV